MAILDRAEADIAVIGRLMAGGAAGENSPANGTPAGAA
jgi:hypothetical protein